MPTEWINCGGKRVLTLAELIRPGVRACFVGINPSPVSVAAGHYYQGRLGKRMWQRLEDAGIVDGLHDGHEDTVAFAQGLAFADLYRCPSPSAKGLGMGLLRSHAAGLTARIEPTAPAPVVFVFKRAFDAAAATLQAAGRTVLVMPSPFAPSGEAEAAMAELARVIGPWR